MVVCGGCLSDGGTWGTGDKWTGMHHHMQFYLSSSEPPQSSETYRIRLQGCRGMQAKVVEEPAGGSQERVPSVVREDGRIRGPAHAVESSHRPSIPPTWRPHSRGTRMRRR